MSYVKDFVTTISSIGEDGSSKYPCANLQLGLAFVHGVVVSFRERAICLFVRVYLANISDIEVK